MARFPLINMREMILLYDRQYNWRSKLNGLSFDSLDKDVKKWLEKSFEDGKMSEVVRSLNSDKALVSMVFLWIFPNMLEVLKKVSCRCFVITTLKASWSEYECNLLVLVLEKHEMIDFENFWPIILVNGVYKILAKFG